MRSRYGFSTGQEGFKTSRVELGWVRRCSKYHRPGLVGSGGFQISIVRSGRVGSP